MDALKPVFDLPGIGTLKLDYIIVEDGNPILFVCQGCKDFYLCLCRSTWPNLKYLIVKANLDLLDDVARRKVPIRNAFIHAEGDAYIVVFNKEFPVGQYIRFPATDLMPNNLPPATLYLHEDYTDDFLDYIAARKYD